MYTVNHRKLQIKFSHKSFWEFFIALDILENPGKSLSQDNLDMAKQFALELNEMYLKGQQLIDVYQFVPTNSCIDLTDPLLTSAFHRLEECQEQSPNNETNQQTLFNIWEIIVGKIVLMQCLLLDSLNPTANNNNDHSSVLKLIRLKSKLEKVIRIQKSFNDLICYIQESFMHENGIDNRLQSIQDKIEQINKEMPQDDLLAIFRTSIKDNILVFPNLFTLSSEIIDKVLSTHTPVIGLGFYNQESVCDLIKRILEKKPAIPVIFVINHSNHVENIIDFIWNVLTQLKTMDIKHSLKLVVVSHIDKITIPYVCGTQNINTSHKELSICLTKMYKIATEIN